MKISPSSLTPAAKKVKNTPYRLKEFKNYLSVSTVDAALAPLFSEEFLPFLDDSEFHLLKKNPSYEKGQALLALLNALRIDLLNGTISYSQIHTLSNFLLTLPKNVEPPLQEIIDEITLRVHIELAKINKMLPESE